MRRSSPHPSLSGASSTSIDYGSGGLHRAQNQAAARFSNETVVLDSTIPLPTHPDPDIFDVPTTRASPVAGASPPASSGSRLVYNPPMNRTANYYSTLPTHSRGNRSPSKTHVRGASLANSSSFSSPTATSTLNPPSGRTSPSVVMPTAETLARTISAPASAIMSDAAHQSHTNGGDRSPTISGSPILKPLVVPPTPTSPSLFLLAYPTTYQSTVTSTTAATTTTASDPLLHASQSDSHSGFGSAIVTFFRSLLIYLCCFMSPSTYDSLERSRIEAAIAANNPLSPYSVYSKNSSARRHHAKERLHRHRQHSTMIAAASRTASVDANANPALASNLLHMHHPTSTTIAATSPLGVTIVGVTTSRDSDSDSDDERETTQTFKSSCDQACCDSSCCRTMCCNGWIRCCTPRRSVCILTYFIFLCGGLFAAYYFFIFRSDGWKFPVRV